MSDRTTIVARMLQDLCYFVPVTNANQRFLGCAVAIEEDPVLKHLDVADLRRATRYWIGQLREDRMPQSPPAIQSLRRAHATLTERDEAKDRDSGFGPVVGTSPQGVPIRREKGAHPLFLQLHNAYSTFCSSAPSLEALRKLAPEAAAERKAVFSARRAEWEDLLPTGSQEVRQWLAEGVDLEARVEMMKRGLPYVDPEEEIEL